MQPRIGKAALWLTIILPFAVGYFFAMAFRAINAILAHPISLELNLDNFEVGWITSVYLLTFALAQLPLGVLLDYWGARKTQSVLFALGAVGIVIFGMASNVAELAIGRAILGIGMAGGLIASIKAIADWVNSEEIPFYNSVILAAGGLGSLMVTMPSKLFEIEFGWRALCFLMSGLTLAVAILIFLVFRDKPEQDADRAGLWNEIVSLKVIYTDRFFWQVAPVVILPYGSFIAMRSLWLGPWLEHVVGFSPLESSHYLFALSLAMILGLAGGGLFAKLAADLRLPLANFIVLGVVAYIGVEVLIVLNVATQGYAVWVAYGFLGQVALVVYALLPQHFGAAWSGRAVTAANIFCFLFAFLAQSAFGLVLHLWPNAGTGQPVDAYKAAFTAIIVLDVLSIAWFVFMARRSPQRPPQKVAR
jgi:MFS family permease